MGQLPFGLSRRQLLAAPWLALLLSPDGLAVQDYGEFARRCITAGAVFLSFKLPLGFGRIVILPHGPGRANPIGSDADELLEALGDHFRKMGSHPTCRPGRMSSRATNGRWNATSADTRIRGSSVHEFSSTLLAVDLAELRRKSNCCLSPGEIRDTTAEHPRRRASNFASDVPRKT